MRIALSLVVLLVCARTAAQTAPVEPPVELPPTESAGAAEARIAVGRARALFGAGDFSAALAEFTRAYELLHGDPRQADVLNNIAVCYERMFRYDLALEYYDRYLRESTTASPEDRAEVESVMSTLRDLLGAVRITGVAGAEIWIDDHRLGEVPLQVPVPAGLHVLEARKTGHETLRRELRVSARAVHTVEVQLEPVDTYRGLSSTYFWIGTGLTAAAAITGSVFGIAALSEDAAGQRDADRKLTANGEPARDLALKADIAFGAAAVFGVASTVLFFLTDWESRPEQRAPELAPAFAVEGTSVTFAILVTGTTP